MDTLRHPPRPVVAARRPARHAGYNGARARPAATAAPDPRWPLVAARLAALREQGRHAVRIVDAECGAGALLLRALDHARAIGFTAVEGRGIDGSPALIGRARAAARRIAAPAIGIAFDVADVADVPAALRAQCDAPADLLLCHGLLLRQPSRGCDGGDLAGTLARAARMVIADPTCGAAA